MVSENKFYKVNCFYCGLPSQRVELSRKEIALCPRCNSKVDESFSKNTFYRALAFAIAALILLLPSHVYPILSFELNGILYSTTFFESAQVLLQQGYGILGVVVFLTAIVFPILLLLTIIFIILDRLKFINYKHKRSIYRLYLFTKISSFIEVFLIALLVAYIKLIDISNVVVHNTLYYFIGAVLFYSLSRRNLNVTRTHILIKKVPNSLNISFALAITGLILYIPSNIFPIMNISKFGVIKPDTIMSGVISLMNNNMLPIAIIVFLASIIVPLFKILGMIYIIFSVKYTQLKNKIFILKLYKFIEAIGKWSVLDIYMIALMAALVREESIAYVEPGIASIYFTLVVFITIISAETFDTKLIWERDGNS